LTKQLTLRIAPFLKFHIDENLKREMNVLQLLQKVREENQEAERRAREQAGDAGQEAVEEEHLSSD
jgi:hypothetical protein